MIEYIINNRYGSIIYTTQEQIQSNKTSLFQIKRLCMESFFTYEGYMKSVRRYFDIKYKIPVYMNEALIMIQTKRAKDDDNIWFNYAAIEAIDILDQGLELKFTSGMKLYINISHNTLKTQIHYLEQIRKRKVNIFITNSIEKV